MRKKSKSKSLNHRRKRRSRKFGNKNGKNKCENSNILSGAAGVAAGTAIGSVGLKLIEQYLSSSIKYTFDERKRKLDDDNQKYQKLISELEETVGINKNLIKQLKDKYKKVLDESFDDALNADRYDYLVHLIQLFPDKTAKEINDLAYNNYPNDIV